MEQKPVKNIDIEKCKELFAYEATQVALALRGEFAAVSGKMTGYEKSRVSDEAKKAPKKALTQMKVPSIEVKTMKMDSELRKKLAASAELVGNMPQKLCDAFSATSVSVPKVPDVSLVEISPVKMTAYQKPVPLAPSVSFKSLPQVTVQVPQIQVAKSVKVSQFSLPEAPRVSNTVKAVQFSKFQLKKPEVKTEKISVKLPSVQSYAILPVPEVAVEKQNNVQGIVIPKTPVVSIPTLKTKKTKINLPENRKNVALVGWKGVPKQRNIEITLPATEKLAVVPQVDIPVIKLETKPTLTGFTPVRQFAMQTTIETNVPQKQKLEVPEVPRFQQLDVAVTVNVQEIDLTVFLDPQKEREKFLREIAEFF